MNWDALQAVGELIAAVGVIVSLAYLAAQVRQNTKSIRNLSTTMGHSTGLIREQCPVW